MEDTILRLLYSVPVDTVTVHVPVDTVTLHVPVDPVTLHVPVDTVCDTPRSRRHCV